jgi:quercetin dioxygenase-like cupin family protein
MQTNNIISGEDVLNSAIPKSQVHIILEIIEYVPDSIVSKIVLKKNGGVTATAFDEGEKFCEKSNEYDTYVQIVDGKAQITINNICHELRLGEGIVIPANTLHCFKAEEQFKMITTIVMRPINES